MIDYRELQEIDIKQIWSIDRSEQITAEYYFRDGGLQIRPVEIDVSGWPVGEPEKNSPVLKLIFERGGWSYGAFDGQVLVGVIVLSGALVSAVRNQLELKFLYVDQKYRKQLLGQACLIKPYKKLRGVT